MLSFLTFAPTSFVLKVIDKNRTINVWYLFPQICSCSLVCCGVQTHSEKWKTTLYKVRFHNLFCKRWRKKMTCAHRLLLGSAWVDPWMSLWCHLHSVDFHICVDLPHKGTCSHVSNSTYQRNTIIRDVQYHQYHSLLYDPIAQLAYQPLPIQCQSA